MRPAPPILELDASKRAELARWARQRCPREACGLLLGQRHGGRVAVAEVSEARNLAAEGAHGRFDLDPADHLAAEERARELGLEVVGVWHSHPAGPARPSAQDHATAWAGWCHVIVSIAPSGEAEVRAWRLAGERFLEMELSY